MKKKTILALLLIFFAAHAAAKTGFVVQSIQINGLQGIPRETVLNYLPIKVGDQIDVNKSTKIIEALYKTGFFERINLFRKNGTLIVQVEQRPIISNITVTGNKKIPTKNLMDVLKKLNVTLGAVLNPSALEKIKASLKRQYITLGNYNARVFINTVKEPRNRVAVKIQISEGTVAKIRQIKIIGNNAFSEKILLKQFKLTTPGLFTFYTHRDEYSPEKLEKDLAALRSYYMDRGYLKFTIDSSQVSLSPDRQNVYISIHITEGGQYKISGYAFTGHALLTKEKLAKLFPMKQGQIFSRKDIISANNSITKALNAKGYANAQVNITPKINDENKTVFLNVRITPGMRVYVRRITFSGNYKTNDNVLRRALLQMEGGTLSPEKIEKSKRALLTLPSQNIRNVEVITTPVQGEPNRVDINFKVTEISTAELKGGVGYSALDKFMAMGALTQNNVFGTGNTLSFSINHSQSSNSASVSYYNPYYTKSGIGRSFSIYGNKFDASSISDISDYALSTYGASVGYDFRISQESSFQLGFGYENDLLDVGSAPAIEWINFVKRYGRHFYQIILNGGWSHQGLDRIIFPTKGLMQHFNLSVSAPISSNSLQYYKASYSAHYYHPIYKNFIGELRGHAGYGDGYGKYSKLPFFKNFYSGGMGSVRGFSGNSLGPKDSKGNTLGGNFEADASAGLIFPNLISHNIRTTWFVDAGNVYDKVNLQNLRISTGLEIDWFSPIGILNFSFATPLRKYSGDDTTFFDFNIGTSF